MMEKKLTEPIRKDRVPLQNIIPLKQPLRVDIDPCDRCNFRCEFCFQDHTDSFHGRIMSLETFNKVVSQLKEFDEPINIIHLYGFGEPLINPKIASFVKILHDENVAKEVAIITNASLLSHELTDALISAGLNKIEISINGLTDEDYLRIVKAKVHFESIYENVKYLYANRKQCHVHVKICGDCFSEAEQKRFVELFADCADTINIDHMANLWPGITVADSDSNLYEMQEAFHTGKDMICGICFYHLEVHSGGEVSPCYVDWKYRQENLGNIHETTLKKIWDSERRKAILLGFLKKEPVPYSICNCCEKKCVTVDLEPYREELIDKF